ncbi:hypothetical protein ACFVXW_16065 [Streptomyces sp. NPDC058251]|uniref:hypothetical protein n=1 Tax=Streptomyces sp. NPDC058251 TaxID=3346404 RepID=UPI0036E99974
MYVVSRSALPAELPTSRVYPAAQAWSSSDMASSAKNGLARSGTTKPSVMVWLRRSAQAALLGR